MTANLNLTCLGAIQLVVRNNANIDFSTNNYNLTLAANSSIVVESGGNISATANCSASDLIYIGSVKVASCNGGGGADTDFPGLVSDGGYNVISASATPICGSGTSTISAAINPTPSASTTYRWYTVASGGTPFLTTTVSSNPYSTTYTTGTLSTATTYYVEATSGSLSTPRKAVTVIVNAIPAAPSVSLTQPTCSVATGTITITAPTSAGMTYSKDGSTYTNTTGVFTSLATGTYSITAKSSSGCISPATNVTINAQPAIPAKPTLSSVTQTTCTVATGSFSVINYNAAYTYAVTPSTGVIISGSTITCPTGVYTVTATLGCTSVASDSVTVNGQPTNTWSASGWSTGSPPTSSQKIVFSHDYSSNSDLTGCSCQVTSGTVTINSGHTLTLINDVKITGGSLTFEDDASLVQINDAAVNFGTITYKRKTTPLKQYDYTYWSSPVVSATLSQLATNSLFYSFNPTTGYYVYQTGATTMAQGVGYIGRAPSGTYSPTQIVETSFVGEPGNGVISAPIVKAATAQNFIGNPYPSALDADLFIAANSSVINGTLYFWTHNTAITNNVYTSNDYAKYNYTGGVGTGTPAATGGVTPTGKIAAGQGFFTEAKPSLANGTYSVTYNNAMRIAGNNTQFFKNTAHGNSTNSISQGLERHRVWLSLRSSLGAYNQMLLGYVEGATNDFDSLFDGRTSAVGNSVSIYTMVGSDDLAIQGKSLPFSETDVVPLGFSTTLNGELSVNLDNFDGLFDNQNVYLLDKTTNTYHDLKTGPYTFVTTNGNFEERFELRFTNQALGTTIPSITDNDIKVITTNHQLEVISPAMAITKIQTYDILGKLLFTQDDLSTNLFQTNSLQLAPQVLLVKVTLDNQQSVTKKIVFH